MPRGQNKVLKLFLVGIEPGSSINKLSSSTDLPQSRYSALLSVVLAEAIKEWSIEALAEIGGASQANRNPLFESADGLSSVAEQVAHKFNLSYLLCEPLPPPLADTNAAESRERAWVEDLYSLECDSVLFVLRRQQFEALLPLARRNGILIQGTMTDFGRDYIDAEGLGLWITPTPHSH